MAINLSRNVGTPEASAASSSSRMVAKPKPSCVRAIVREMSEDVLVGILGKPAHPILAMVVDKRVSKTSNGTPPRQVRVTFSDLVAAIDVVDTAQVRRVGGEVVDLSLAGGEGVLLVLEARPDGVAQLDAIARVGATRPTVDDEGGS